MIACKNDIMCPKEKQATPKVAFVFLGPLTNEPPASAGSRARKCGVRECGFVRAEFVNLMFSQRTFYIRGGKLL